MSANNEYCDITVQGLNINYLRMSEKMEKGRDELDNDLLWLKVCGCNSDNFIEISIPSPYEDEESGTFLALVITTDVAKHMIRTMELIIETKEQRKD